MQSICRPLLLTATSILLVCAGCLRICDQRITIRHDQATDTLWVLIHYDGVHNSDDNQGPNGSDQLAQLIANDEIMLADPFLTLKMAELRRLADDTKLPAEQCALSEALSKQVAVKPVGHYRDAMGRIGLAQMITITHVSAFMSTLNTAINGVIREQGVDESFLSEADFPGTRARIVAAAEADFQWLTLDGHALKISAPVHRAEWAVVKSRGIFSAFKDSDEYMAGKDAAQRAIELDHVAEVIHSLAELPFAYSETAGIVSLRIGDPAEPTPIRFEGNNEYKPNLEADLLRLAKIDVDELVAGQLLRGEAGPKDAYVAAVGEWGPPEERVRAIARAAGTGDAATAKAAYDWLNKFRIGWNHEHNLPAMPLPNADDDRAAFAQACLAWCQDVRKFPDPRSEPATTPTPKQP